MILTAFIKDLLFPKQCLGCRKFGVYLCANCKKKLTPVDKDRCPYCGKASYFGFTHPGCIRENGLDGLKSIIMYDGFAKTVIATIKYRLVTDAIDELLRSLPTDKIEELLLYKKITHITTMIPVPLHTDRQKRRGFNHAEKLGVYFSKHLDLPTRSDRITRIKNTPPQATMKSGKDRYQNIRGAFALPSTYKKSEKIEGIYLIFDDVWTTGSTIKEITKVLKRSGAEKVYALTLARARW